VDEVDRVLVQGLPFLSKPIACGWCGRNIKKKVYWWNRRAACQKCWDMLANGDTPRVIIRRRKATKPQSSES